MNQEVRYHREQLPASKCKRCKMEFFFKTNVCSSCRSETTRIKDPYVGEILKLRKSKGLNIFGVKKGLR
jgi:uncharacterized OB-fold protein